MSNLYFQDSAQELLHKLTLPAVCLLRGEMGAGKTTFARAVAELLQVRTTIQSPTYNLKHTHNGTFKGQAVKLYHLDLYRLGSSDAAYDLFDELNTKDDIWLIEWPEKVNYDWQQLAGNIISITIKMDANQNRLVKVE